jgi:Golgi to ER traffic protein 4
MASIGSLEKRLERAFASGDYYAYEQACQTYFHRLATPTAPPESHEIAVSKTLAAAARLNAVETPTAAAALALLALRHLHDRKAAISQELLTLVRDVTAGFAPTETAVPGSAVGDPARREQLRVARAGIRWTSSSGCRGATANGDVALNVTAGRAAAALGEYGDASRFYICGDNPKEHAAVLAAWCDAEGLASERDLFLTRCVLQYATSENLGDAGEVRVAFCERVGWAPRGADTPCLVSFCEMIVMACTLGDSGRALFEKILSVYQSALGADPAFGGMLQRIGQMYFGIQPPPPSGMAGMMQNMLRGMMAPS